MGHMKTCPTCSGTGRIEPPFGERIKSMRNDVGMTQVQLARAIGISRPSLANIESGRQELGTAELVVLAKTFEVSTDYLLGLTNHST